MNPDTIFTRRDTLYFDDGNIVLAANLANNTGSVVFKVHKSVMAAHSPVFADMFSLPDAETASEAYDGVPLVRMPDPAEDLQKLLEALYCKPPFVLVHFSPHTPSIARPVLALSTKYEIAHLRQVTVDRLEADWPQTLDKWDELESAVAYRRSVYLHADLPFVDDIFPEPASALRLARDFDILSILPAVFYHLMRIPISFDRDILHNDDPNGILMDGGRTARWSLLQGDELLLILRGREQALRVLRHLLFNLDWNPNHPVPDNRLCTKDSHECLKDIFQTCSAALDSRRSDEDILFLLLPATWDKKEKERKICPLCRLGLESKIRGLRLAFWERLPEIFGLAKQTAEAGV